MYRGYRAVTYSDVQFTHKKRVKRYPTFSVRGNLISGRHYEVIQPHARVVEEGKREGSRPVDPNAEEPARALLGLMDMGKK